ncbi:glycosyltransferase [Silvimonas sp.]|uniref:glycosyltransferase n=1 Tax=Silvimonas sp. TaxID=2650811 RepID=UPI0028472BCE|nr:glycosyltransferase [Silvimonas sp.]MDR3429574.1 glycosyltransferase [Silvimonas sp.]
MIIYYFIHTVGRDTGNSGIPRVSRNLGSALQAMPKVTLVPVRWDEVTSNVVHVEQAYHDVMRLHGGPDFGLATKPGTAVHNDSEFGNSPAWLLVPEAPHLGGREGDFGPTHLPFLSGYARLHGLRTAAIFHDAMPITHLGKLNERSRDALSLIIYTMALAAFDVVLPVSHASGEEVTGLFGRYGIAWQPESRIFEPVLLPEELKGQDRLAFLNSPANHGSRHQEFCMWGTIFPHKNQLAVMEAFNLLCQARPDLDLVLNHVGSIDPACVGLVGRWVRRSQGRIKLHGFVSDAELMELIRRSRATVFASRVEGYGLPLAESLWLGRPCITSQIAPMTEIAAGGGAVLVDPASPVDIARAMERVATDDVFFAGLLNQLRQRPMRTWNQYGTAVVALLAKFADRTDAASARPQPAYYTPGQRSCAKLNMESFVFTAHDMQFGKYLTALGSVRKIGSIFEYRNAVDTAGPARSPADLDRKNICFGPYYSMGPGEYQLRIDGVLQGTCYLKITSDEGVNTLLDIKLDSLAGTHVVMAPRGVNKLEIILLASPALQYLRIESFSLTRWHDC